MYGAWKAGTGCVGPGPSSFGCNFAVTLPSMKCPTLNVSDVE